MTAGPHGALGGVLPVIMTPFAADWSIDARALGAEIDWVFENGAHGLCIAMVSEIQRMTAAERAALTELVVRLARGRGPVVASVGAESVQIATALAAAAYEAGASALMATPPLLGGAALPVAELRDYLGAIRRAAPLPLILQDASGYAGAAISPQTQAGMVAEFGASDLALKPEAPPIGPTVSAILEASAGSARIFDGSGGVSLMDTHRRGIVGTMPGPDLVWAVRALWDALERGDDATALELTRGLSTLISMVPGLDGYVAFGKFLLATQGVIPSDRMRGPVLFRLDDTTRELITLLFGELRRAVDGAQPR